MESSLCGTGAALAEVAHQQKSGRLKFMLGESNFALNMEAIGHGA